ncbi:CheR methyltransferase, SAM binding domain [Tranquillimonas alkanivorans]|uniref:CheR methyltransferase, SAM binding domain n=1 Tax=Tranquillimonas alkanivorans TaxID=441119 RepID=A0A1I5M483_9RHOB|nr:CheR methyltransferase, SAM binding domain [Tranquillimonas alkanivorans]
MQGRDENGATLLRIVPELRRRARFSALNLIEIPYPIDQDLDVIFLRNVLIYFEPDLQERIVTAMCGHLRPGGYLFVGHTESAVVRAPALRQLSPAVFRKEVS